MCHSKTLKFLVQRGTATMEHIYVDLTTSSAHTIFSNASGQPTDRPPIFAGKALWRCKAGILHGSSATRLRPEFRDYLTLQLNMSALVL